MTLRELIDKKGFRTWLATKLNPNKKVFKPIALSESNPARVIGESGNGYGDCQLLDDDRFVEFINYDVDT